MVAKQTATRFEEYSVDRLNRMFTEFIESTYGFTPTIRVGINKRYRRKLGVYRHSSQGDPLGIELSGFLIEFGTPFQIESTLRHEAIHYALHTLGRPYTDGHPEFEAELERYSATSSGTQYVPQRRTKYTYRCHPDCVDHATYRKLRTGYTYTCNTCGHVLELASVNQVIE